MSSDRTLLLDSSFYPIQLIDWKRAMILFLTDRAEVVENHEEIDIRSQSLSFKLPKVLRLLTNFKRRKPCVKFSRYNVYYRDNWTCQYCTKKFPTTELTFDHVLPRSRGGQTSWENIVTCCNKCNTKKGSELLRESGMRLLNVPRKPDWTPQMTIRLRDEEEAVWGNWLSWTVKANTA